MFLDRIATWFTGRSGQSSTRKCPGTTLKVEGLEAREVPAFLSGGHLNIVGTNAVDDVRVLQVGSLVHVSHNGVEQNFPTSSIIGQIRFWGLGGDDTFATLNVTKPCFVDGGAGKDVITGGNGDDLLLGGSEADVIFGAFGNDTIRGGDGEDRLDGGFGDDTLFGEDGVDILLGGGNNDLLFGGEGGDLLKGGDGADKLYGEAGNDFIFGGAGLDAAFGGSGADQFWEVGTDDADSLLIGPPTRGQPRYGVLDREAIDTVWS